MGCPGWGLLFSCGVLAVFCGVGGIALSGFDSFDCGQPVASRFFVEQNRILWVTLPIKLGIPDTPEVLVLCIAPNR